MTIRDGTLKYVILFLRLATHILYVEYTRTFEILVQQTVILSCSLVIIQLLWLVRFLLREKVKCRGGELIA